MSDKEIDQTVSATLRKQPEGAAMAIARIYTKKPKYETDAQTTRDLVLDVNGTQVDGISKIVIGENGSLELDGFIVAQVTMLVRLGRD